MKAVIEKSENISAAPGEVIRGYPASAADRLLAIADELRPVQLPMPESLTTTVAEVAACKRPETLYEGGWPKKCPAIYRIGAATAVAGELWRLAQSEHERRKAVAVEHKNIGAGAKVKHEYQMARLNGYEGKACLYVGKANDLTPRLRQHFGKHSPTTFAMHLSMWAPVSLWKKTLTIEYWPLQDLGLSTAAIQALEDFIWEDSAPVFGKQGAK
ncbi:MULTISPECIES: hypothetical protein [Corallococcus]|uniref:hypothetical protein n=1 Tax=Corallococcus TaxID=83461 RepID=UPI0011C36B92|nr:MULTISPECIES: hypothetical protein [Corallococcus]